MSHPDSGSPPAFEPRAPALVAALIFLIAAATLCYPMLSGQVNLGDDQLIAGYGFRVFGAEQFRATGSVPQWNPFIMGGLPFIAAGHGEIFYPTAWLRYVLPVDTAMNVQIAIHLFLAGCTLYAFARALRVSWAAAVGAGVGYELSGMIASQMSPGHDGKMIVASLAPLVFLGLLYAIRDGRWVGYGMVALGVGLGLISPHFQMVYYLLVAAGIWTLYLLFWHPERHPSVRWPFALAAALGAVVLGAGLAAIQIIPFLQYIPFSPRAATGPSTGWEYATGYAMPVEEIMTTVLPQFNGVLRSYWGQNGMKLHTEYLGAIIVILAALGWGDRSKRKLMWGLTIIGGLFLLVSFGGHTPFYRLWYEVMPMMKKVRAAGMAFYLPTMVVCLFAAFGLDQLFRGQVKPKTLGIMCGAMGLLALLGAGGVLQGVATSLAPTEAIDRVIANGDGLRDGSLRLLIVTIIGGAVLAAVAYKKIPRAVAPYVIVALILGDNWSVLRDFTKFYPPAKETFREDEIISRLRNTPLPYRVWHPGGGYGQLSVYEPGALLAWGVPTLLGYHGNEIRYFDDLLGEKNLWRNQINPNLWDLYGIRYILLGAAQQLPGYHKVLGSVPATGGRAGVLYEADTIPNYVHVMSAAAKVKEEQIVPTAVNPRFPALSVVLYPDTASVSPDPVPTAAAPPTLKARISDWKPGHMTVSLDGRDTRQTYLVVAENWFPDWHVTIDGTPAPLLRADNALLSVAVPSGAREVHFDFASAVYSKAKLLSLVSCLLTLALLVAPRFLQRRETVGG